MGAATQAFFTHIDEASRLIREGDRERASATLDSALALLDAQPQAPAWHEAVSEPLWRLGRLAEAAQHLEVLLALRPSAAEASRRLAGAYIRLGRLQDAVTLLKDNPIKDNPGSDAAYHLHLGTALRYRGFLEEARPALKRAFALAKEAGHLPAAIAALTAEGELELAAENPKEAVILFGKALGLTERSMDEALTVLPLAGLAEAQVAWGYSAKGLTLAEKAKARAQKHDDKVALTRALISLGVASKKAQTLLRAVAEADAAPHLPLALKASIALAEVQPGSVKLPEAVKLAERLGMTLELYKLSILAQRPRQKSPKPPASS